MLGRSHLLLVLAQFGVALAGAAGVLLITGVGTRSVLGANLAAGGLLLATTAICLARGHLLPNRRLARVWPVVGALLLPMAFVGWGIEPSEPLRSRPDLLAVLHCALPFTALLVLQASLAVPSQPPTASEVAVPAAAIARRLTYLVLALAGTLLVVAIGARFIVPPASPLHDQGIAFVLPLLAAAFACNALHAFGAPALHFSAQPARLVRLGAAAGGANLLLNLLLVPALGVAGAALSALLTYAALAATSLRAAGRHSPVPWEYQRMAKIACAAAIVYGAVLRWPRTEDWLLLAGYGVLTAGGFVIVLGLSGFLERRERTALGLWSLPRTDGA